MASRWQGVASLFALVVLTFALSGQAEAKKKITKKIAVKWLGHATFEILSPGGTRLLVDPFITGNPKTPATLKNLDDYKPHAILVSHSHFDHMADVAVIATKAQAKVIGTYELVSKLGVGKHLQRGGNVGGTFKIGDVSVHLVPAMHSSSPGGRPVGFVIRFSDGRSIYHTGDTWIFSDMALIQAIYKPTIILMQAGGGPYNQDPKVAALAVKKFFRPKVIVPMHYGTFGILASEADVKKAFGKDKRLKIMQPGQTLEL